MRRPRRSEPSILLTPISGRYNTRGDLSQRFPALRVPLLRGEERIKLNTACASPLNPAEAVLRVPSEPAEFVMSVPSKPGLWMAI